MDGASCLDVEIVCVQVVSCRRRHVYNIILLITIISIYLVTHCFDDLSSIAFITLVLENCTTAAVGKKRCCKA